MQRIIWALLMLSILIVPSLSTAGFVAPARVKLADGEVLFLTPDTEEWLPVSVNTPLDEGDAIWCPEGSRTEIQLADGTVVRLDGGSQLDLLANEDEFTHLHLASGRLYLRTARGSAGDSLQIDADDTTVLPSARTRLRIEMLPNSREDVAIFKGSAYVEGSGSRTSVRAGEQITLEEGHQDLLTLNPPDSWDNWNLERDRAQSRSARSESYLPEELGSYSSELDANGRWERVPEYGMVWRPTVILSNDWAPYRSGRWIWKGDDYVWISFENWGWVPYHFGRWAVVAGLGWCWIPPARGDVYWGPGYVGWHHTGSHIGWTPLAPGEIFYGRRYYGRHSVNITTTRVNPGTIAYRNRNVRGGLTVIQQNDFLRGRVTTQTRSKTPSVSVSVSIGSPRIQPLRETRMPIVKQTPPRVAPPRIEHRDSRVLRERFPRVTPNANRQQRPQQPAPVISTPPAPAIRQPSIRDRKDVRPAVPAENKARPESKPQPVTPQRPQQPAPVISTPPAPAIRQPPIRDRKDVRPAVPAENKARPESKPQPITPQRPQQPAPAISTPPAPATRQPPIRDRKDVRPAVPAETRTRPESQPQPPQQRDEYRRRSTEPQTAPPAVKIAPQRVEPPRVKSPAASPPRAERRQGGAGAVPAVTAPQAAPSPSGEQPKREVKPREVKQKKERKVTTPDQSNEKDDKDKEQRKERKER